MSEDVQAARNAIHQAMHKADIQRTTGIARIDPYEREARSIIVPGRSGEEVVDCVCQRMALKIVSSSDKCVQFEIALSTKYKSLRVWLCNHTVTGYELCAS